MINFTSYILIALLLITSGTLGCSAVHAADAIKQPAAVEMLIDLTMEDVRAQFGEPDRSGPGFDVFFTAGLVVNYDRMKRVTQVTATHVISGNSYKGTVLGVALGDPIQNCVAVWGDAVKTETTPYEYKRVTWHHNQYELELEVWTRDGDGTDAAFGYYKEGTVKTIMLSRKSP